MRRNIPVIIALLVFGCTGKNTSEQTDNQIIEVDSATEFYENPESKKTFIYKQFAGIYDHENNAQGFAAVLAVTESGNELMFTLTVSQGSCKGKAEGKITMVSHEEYFYTGFYEPVTCPLQFNLMLRENKIDIKEITVCRLHDNGCSFEGNYIKRNAR